MIRVALTGKKTSGKTSVANYLCASYGFKRLSFGNHLKRVCSTAINKPLNKFYDNKSELVGDGPAKWDTYRDVLIKIGQSIKQHYPDIWVDYVLNELNTYYPESNVVIDDLRFLDEYKAIKNEGFYVVKVVRPGIEESNDITETEMDGIPVDLVVYNNGQITELHKVANQIYQTYALERM